MNSTQPTKTKKHTVSAWPINTKDPKKPKNTKRPNFVPDNEPLSCYPKYLIDKKPKWWGTQTIPKNQCYTKKKNGCKDWTANKCWVKVGEVQLIYFPPPPLPKGNETLSPAPKFSTMYDPVFDYTL